MPWIHSFVPHPCTTLLQPLMEEKGTHEWKDADEKKGPASTIEETRRWCPSIYVTTSWKTSQNSALVQLGKIATFRHVLGQRTQHELHQTFGVCACIVKISHDGD